MWDEIVRQFNRTFIEKDNYKMFLKGFGNTLVITVFATLIGVVIGVLIAVAKVNYAQNKRHKWLDVICNIYISVIRGTPVVVQLMIMYFIILKSLSMAVIVAIITFGINSGAYVAEVVRAGIMAIDPGQAEAGRSLGLSSGQTMRLIILPQAIKNILPALGNEFITLLKETSVAGYISILDLTFAGELVRGNTMLPYFPLLSVAVIYLVLVMGISRIIKVMERRLRKSDRS